jgi:hypothetical protein
MEPVIRTASGRYVNPLNLRPEDVDVNDIAHHLSLINRFNGASRHAINVASHSLFVALLCAQHPVKVQMQALFHDASEAYLGDVTKWVKRAPEMEAYRKAEAHAQHIIYEFIGVPTKEDSIIEWADWLMVRAEHESDFGFGVPINGEAAPRYPPLSPQEVGLLRNIHWRPLEPETARYAFLHHYRFLKTLV